VLDWADQLLDALDYLHTHEPAVIHRDIKPQNLKLTSRDRIMLLDFGLAKGASQASQMTATGSLFGYSFHYAPLEQMQATGTDPRSDLYSLGATLYHLMTNVTPPDAITRATAVLNGEADPLRLASEVQAQVSEPVARVIARAMAQNAAQRPQTAAEMREALRDAGKEVVAARIQTFAAPISEAGIEKQDKLTGGLSAAPASVVVASSISDRHANSSSGSHYDMTVIEPVSAKHGPPTSLSHKRGESSITKMRPFEPAQPRPRGQGRALSIVMSVVLLAIVAAVVYTFTRSSSPQNPSAQNVASQNDSTAASPTAPPLNGSQTSSTSSQSPAGSQPPQQTSSLPVDYSRSQPAASSANPQPVVATNENPTSVQTGTQGPSGNPVANPNALTAEEERARRADEIRRERREKDEQDMRRQREALEEEQRRERERMYMERARPDRPPPPAGFPPPRRDGPPPPHQR
jgi:serine/threonine protein kinase